MTTNGTNASHGSAMIPTSRPHTFMPGCASVYRKIAIYSLVHVHGGEGNQELTMHSHNFAPQCGNSSRPTT
jgi:hypothetical protein